MWHVNLEKHMCVLKLLCGTIATSLGLQQIQEFLNHQKHEQNSQSNEGAQEAKPDLVIFRSLEMRSTIYMKILYTR